MGRPLVPRRLEQPLLLGAAGLLLAAVALLPLLSLAGEMLRADLAGVAHVLGAARTWRLFGSSVALALAVTASALAIGLPLGLLLGRGDVPGRGAAMWLHAFPLFLPPFLLALGWFHLVGREGLVGTRATAAALFSPAGAAGVLALALSPVVTLLVAVALQAVDPSLEEAALLAGGPWRAATRILLPLTRPAVALGALVVFSLAFSELGVPMFLRVAVYPAMVFVRLGGVDYAPGEAFALSLPLVGVSVALLLAERRAAGRRSFAALGLRTREASALALGRWRAAAAGLAWALAVLPLAPVAALAWRAGRAGFAELPRWVGASPLNSLLGAVGAATFALLVAIPVGHAAARGFRGGAALDAVAIFAFLTPASVLGAGLIAAWDRPATLALYASAAIVGVALAARYAAVGVRTAGVVFAQGATHLEEAAATCGAGYLRRLARILVPIHARGLGAAWILTVLFCLRDLEAAILIYPAGSEPLTVRIFTLEANGPPAVVAALACAQVALAAGVLASGGMIVLGRRA